LKAKIITASEFKNIFGYIGKLTREYLKNGIELQILNSYEVEEAFLLHSRLMEKKLQFSGPARLSSWESGWEENLIFLKQNQDNALLPRYFGKYPYIRFKQEFYGASEHVELLFLRALLLNEIERQANGLKPERIVEFGCGTGHNLFFLNSKVPNLQYVGLDWTSTSSQVIQYAAKLYATKNISAGPIFDYYNPNYDFNLKVNDFVVTVASLEQVGTNHSHFIDYLIAKKPGSVIHIEPEPSLLDSENRFDKTSIDYMNMRGYLSNFYSELKIREENGQIRIIRAQRSFLGSFPMDGYSIFVWKPINEV